MAVAVGGALICVLGGALALGRLELKTARIELTGAELPFARRFLDLEREFGDLNRIVVRVRSPQRSRSVAYADALAAQVRSDSEHFAGVFERSGPDELGSQTLLLLPEQALGQGETLARRVLPHWRQGALSGTLLGWAEVVEARLDGDPASPLDAALAERGERMLEDVGELCRAGAASGDAPTPFDSIAAWDEAGYLWGPEDSLLVLIAYREDSGGLDPRTASVARARALIRELQPAWPEVEVGLTGKPVLEVDEMATYEADSLRASVVALVSVTLLLVLALRRLSAPLLVGGCLALSVAGTLGLATLWPGHLNLMAVVFVMVVIGLGVDFAIHLVGRYDEARAGGLEASAALEESLSATGPALLAGALTTAGAFCGAACTDFKGLREFGVVAGFGVLAALFVSLSVVPALLLLFDSRAPRAVPSPWLRWLERWTRRSPRRVLLGVVVVTGLALGGASRLRYEGNLLLLQDPALPSVQLEHALLREPGTTSWFLAYPARDLREAAEVTARARRLSSVDRVESVLDLRPPGSEARLGPARQLRERLADWLGSERPASTARGLRAGAQRLVLALERALDEALAGGAREALPVLERLLGAARRLLAGVPADELPSGVLAYEVRLVNSLERRVRPLVRGELGPLSPDTLAPALRERFVGAEGRLLVRIYPKQNLWDPAGLQSFVREVESEVPGVTGVPAMLHGASSVMVESYRQAGWIALVLVSLSLLVLFRSLRATCVALTALAVGVVWTAGLMGWLGFDLNPANLIALPLMLGVGIDTAVHVVHRARAQEGQGASEAPLVASSLGRALLFSGLTSVASFGTLALARHPGTASMGVAISLAILACSLAGLIVAPALWVWSGRE